MATYLQYISSSSLSPYVPPKTFEVSHKDFYKSLINIFATSLIVFFLERSFSLIDWCIPIENYVSKILHVSHLPTSNNYYIHLIIYCLCKYLRLQINMRPKYMKCFPRSSYIKQVRLKSYWLTANLSILKLNHPALKYQ